MSVGKHLGFFSDFRQIQFKSWLNRNASEVLSEIGIGEGYRVLDFGCGSGDFSIASARLVGDSGKVYSMDVSQNILDKLSIKVKDQNINNVSIMLSTGINLPFDECSLDHVLLIDVLQEITDKVKLFENVKKILKIGGQVTVYPMHLDGDEVSEIATGAGLDFSGKKFKQQILVFKKSDKLPETAATKKA